MRIPFGKHKNKKIDSLPRSYLEWMVKTLKGTDFNEYALYAEKILESPAIKLELETEALEDEATEFLKRHGYSKYGK